MDMRVRLPPPLLNQTQTKMSEESIPNKLRSMEVGETLGFPLAQVDYIRNVIPCRLMQERIDGYAWATKADKEKQVLLVTRVS